MYPPPDSSRHLLLLKGKIDTRVNKFLWRQQNFQYNRNVWSLCSVFACVSVICLLYDFHFKTKKYQRCQGGMAKKIGRNMILRKPDDHWHILEACFFKKTNTCCSCCIHNTPRNPWPNLDLDKKQGHCICSEGSFVSGFGQFSRESIRENSHLQFPS